MSGDDHRDLVFGVQALRREVERDNQLGGAYGMAAWPWPHQVAQVKAILEDVCVRHCLADEVGLGKTVQAVAVVRALLIRQPALRVAFFVPDELVSQWRDEALARGGFAVDGAEVAVDDDTRLEQRPLLVWPGRLRTEPALWERLKGLDALVVDELPRLTAADRSRLARLAGAVSHLLLLTATPPLTDGPEAAALLELIEPIRARLGGERPWSHLVSLEQRAAEAHSAAPRKGIAAAFAATRRLLRAQRASWRGALPMRRIVLHEVEPTQAELERERLLWRWMRVATDTSREFDLHRLAQRVRSRASLRQRVTYLKGHDHDRDGLLERLSGLLGAEHGDSRYEGLCDVLATIWRDDPEAKVLIGAADNLTTDDLAERLPVSFDDQAGGKPLRVARIRNQTKGPEKLVDPEDQIRAAVSAFRSGEAQVLLLTEQSVAGLNLQVTRHVVLYALPWDIDDLEQLLGRVDRIGNQAATAADEDEAHLRPIEVHIIMQLGTVDERVCRTVVDARLLERPLATTREDVQALVRRVSEVGLEGSEGAWGELAEVARRVAERDEQEARRMPLRALLPASAERAPSAAAAVLDRGAAWPTLATVRPRWLGWADGLRAWLAALSASREYRFGGSASGRGLEEFGYFNSAGVRDPASHCRRPLPSLPRFGEARVQTHRKGREVDPPARYRRQDGRVARHVVFMDHGAALHEELLLAWRLLRPNGHAELRFAVRAGKGSLAALRGAVVALAVGRIDASRLLNASGEADASNMLGAAHEADRRFFLGQVASEVVAAGVVLVPGGLTSPLDRSALEALLGVGLPSLEVPRSEAWAHPAWLPDREVEKALSAAWSRARAAARTSIEAQLDGLREAVAARAFVLEAEAEDLRALVDPSEPRTARAGEREGALAAGSAFLDRARAIRAAVGGAEAGSAFVLSVEALILVR